MPCQAIRKCIPLRISSNPSGLNGKPNDCMAPCEIPDPGDLSGLFSRQSVLNRGVGFERIMVAWKSTRRVKEKPAEFPGKANVNGGSLFQTNYNQYMHQRCPGQQLRITIVTF